jgi:hypothetical protein
MIVSAASSKPDRKVRWVSRNIIIAALGVGCTAMSAVCVQQAQTISAQRTLIQQLLQDSLQLDALRLQRLPAKHE